MAKGRLDELVGTNVVEARTHRAELWPTDTLQRCFECGSAAGAGRPSDRRDLAVGDPSGIGQTDARAAPLLAAQLLDRVGDVVVHAGV